MDLFDKELEFRGKHANYLRELKTDTFNCITNYIEILPTAAILGYLEKRTPDVDNSDTVSTATVPREVMRAHGVTLYLVYCSIFLDIDREEPFNTRADRIFKAETLERKKEFEAYIRGGLEVLHEQLFVECFDQTRRSERIFELFEKYLSMTNGKNGILELLHKAQNAK
ncbi:hypothetical protein [Anaerobiospirillum succiniciproducens]|uniref:hypothetical protein n=1 Tax=Anaerobiospirillum succiniciproducens TaxID=13335 RepID=UPI003F89CD04